MPVPSRTPRPLDSPEDVRQLVRWRVIGLACMVALIVAFPIYNFGEPARRAAAQAEMATENVEIGRKMFAQHCASCHGDEARGGRTAPTLSAREFLGSVSDRQLNWLIAGGIPGTVMSAYDIDLGGPFSTQEVARLTAYLRSLEEGAPSVPGWFTGAAAPERVRKRPAAAPRGARASPRHETSGRSDDGSDDVRQVSEHVEGSPDSTTLADAARATTVSVYASRCAACHGANGQGTPIAPAVRPLRPALMQQPELVYEKVAKGVPSTAMSAFSTARGGPLDDTTIRALVAWMLHADRPAERRDR